MAQSIREKLRNLVQGKELENDGSQEVAREWLELLDTQEALNDLLKNEAFKKVLGNLERDFRSRMVKLVESDPELRAIKKMFIRTVGLKNAEQKIEKQMVEYLQDEE